MDKIELENSILINIQFDKYGLAPAIVQDVDSGDVLMLGYINANAFEEALASGYATFWSRSRNELWKKGETSGNLLEIVDVFVDCDQDCVIYKVNKASGGACHTKNEQKKYRQSCFYRKINFKERKLENIDK